MNLNVTAACFKPTPASNFRSAHYGKLCIVFRVVANVYVQQEVVAYMSHVEAFLTGIKIKVLFESGLKGIKVTSEQ